MSSGGRRVWLCSPFPGRHPRSIKTEEGPFPSGSYGGHPFTLRRPGGHVTLPQVRWGWGCPSQSLFHHGRLLCPQASPTRCPALLPPRQLGTASGPCSR